MDEATAVKLARAGYQASTNYFDSSIRSLIESDLRQAQSVHEPGSKYRSDAWKGRSKLFRPKTRVAIRKNEAMAAEAFFSTHDTITVAPEDDRDKQQAVGASMHQYLLQTRLTHPQKGLPWFITVLGAYQDAMTVGVVASYQYWEVKRDRPMIKLLPVENLRFDPGAEWYDVIGTSPYVIEMIPMYIKDVKARMSAPEGIESKWLRYPDADIQTASRTSDTIRQTREHQRTDSKEQNNEITDYSLVWVHRNTVEHEGEDWIYYTLNDEKLLSKPKPLVEVYHPGVRQYVLGFSVIETHRQYPSGIPRMGRDLQIETNDIANQRIDNVRFAMNKRYFVTRNKQVDVRSLTRNVPGSVTLMQDTEKDVKVLETQDVTASAYKEQDRLNLDFDDVAGGSANSTVASNRSLNETVGGMNMLKTQENQIGAYSLRTFIETWCEPVLRQVLLMEREYETDERLLMLAASNARALERLDMQAIPEGFIDAILDQEVTVRVNVGMSASNPQMKMQNFMLGIQALTTVIQAGLERYGMKMDEVISEIFGLMGYRDGSRFFDLDKENPAVAALLAKMEELQAALEAKHPPELVAAMVEELQAKAKLILADEKKSRAQGVNENVKASYAAIQGAATIVQAPALAPIADKILEGAGHIPDPAGVDPNLPQPEVDPAMATLPEQPGEQPQAVGQPNTSPMSPPVAASPMAGIETPGAEPL